MTVGKSKEKVTLAVYESFDSKLGLNSDSDLAIKLSSNHDIYVVCHERGADPSRKATFTTIPPAMIQLADIANSPKTYRVVDRYSGFFKRFFTWPLKDQEIKRFPGLQDRDTFYGYLRTKPDTSYNGVNLKVSHPVFCPDEGTRKSARLQKAEYLGAPFHEKDVLFFEIEDNAIYLDGQFDQRFGTFTGKESFDGVLELLNDKGTTLLKTTAKFKSWQR